MGDETDHEAPTSLASVEWSFDAERVESTLTRRWSLDSVSAAEEHAGKLEGAFAPRGLSGNKIFEYDVTVDGSDVQLTVETAGDSEQDRQDVYLGTALQISTTLFQHAYRIDPENAKEAAWMAYNSIPEPGEDD